MKCRHDLAEDCPECMADEIERLRAALTYIYRNGEYMSGVSCADHAMLALEQDATEDK